MEMWGRWCQFDDDSAFRVRVVGISGHGRGESSRPRPGRSLIKRLNEAAGYAPNNVVQGFTVMHPDKSAAVIGLLDLRPGITPEDFEKALEELDVDKVLDANRTARVRTEQGYIRQALLGGRIDAECAVCGSTRLQLTSNHAPAAMTQKSEHSLAGRR